MNFIKIENETATKVSFWVAHLLASKKSYLLMDSYGCLCAAAEEIYPDKINLLKTISLSVRTTGPRIEDISNNISHQLKTRQFIPRLVLDVLTGYQYCSVVAYSNNQFQVWSDWGISFYKYSACKNNRLFSKRMRKYEYNTILNGICVTTVDKNIYGAEIMV